MITKLRATSFLLGGTLLVPLALGSPQEQAVPAVGVSEITTVILGLIFVIGIIFACAWFMRRINGGTAVNGRAIKVLAVTPLGAKEKLVLVGIGKQQLLLGITPQQITTLHELTEPLDLQSHPEGSPFARQLGALIGGKGSNKQTGSQAE